MAELTEFAEEVVKPALQQVDGISKAEVVGGLEREMLVQPDARKMGIYGITVEQIQQALVRSNVSFPGGRIRQGPLQMQPSDPRRIRHDRRHRGDRHRAPGPVARARVRRRAGDAIHLRSPRA